jgi:hypothetical protein
MGSVMLMLTASLQGHTQGGLNEGNPGRKIRTDDRQVIYLHHVSSFLLSNLAPRPNIRQLRSGFASRVLDPPAHDPI